VRGGVRLIDAPGASLFDELGDGEPVTIRGASIFRNGTCLASGRALDAGRLEAALTHVLGEGRQPQEPGKRLRGHIRARSMATFDETFLDESIHRVPDGHPGDTPSAAQHALARNTCARS